jgi:hypothetical protein
MRWYASLTPHTGIPKLNQPTWPHERAKPRGVDQGTGIRLGRVGDRGLEPNAVRRS